MENNHTRPDGSESKLAVVFSLDEQYLDPFSVALGSLLMTNDVSKIEFYVFYDAESSERLFSDRVNSTLEKLQISLKAGPTYISVDAKDYSAYESTCTGSHMTYGKIAALKHVKEDYILCLDCDCLITGDIFGLLQEYRQELPCAAVTDLRSPTHDKEGYTINGRKPENNLQYFNAGVLLFNRKRCKTDEILVHFNQIADQVEGARYDDQTYLNIVFNKQWQRLSPKWNAQTSDGRTQAFYDSQISPIIHYIGKRKPWLSPTVNAANYLWLNYARALEIQVDEGFSKQLSRSYFFARFLSATKLLDSAYLLYRWIGKDYRRSAGRLRDIRNLKNHSQILNEKLIDSGIAPPRDPLSLY